MIEPLFLGIGAAFCPDLGNNAACFEREGCLYLIDCGSTVFSRLMASGLLKGAREIRVLITHLHQDHVGSLATLISYCKHVSGQRIRLIHPKEALAKLLRLHGITREQYDFLPEMSYRDEWIKARFVSVAHSGNMACFGVLLQEGADQIYYSGDAEKVPEKVWDDFLSGQIRALYQDLALTPEPIKGHGHYESLVKALPAALRSRLFPMHWNQDYRDRIQEDGLGLVRLLPCAKVGARSL